MIITITRNVIKNHKTIQEIISVFPESYILKQDNRSIFNLIEIIKYKISIAKYGFHFLESVKNNFSTINIFEKQQMPESIKPTIEYSFKYTPSMGKKKCSKCIHFCKPRCKLRLCKVNGDYWDKCFYWTENLNVEIIK